MFHLDGRGRFPALILSGGLAAALGLTAALPAHAAPALGTVTFAAGRGAVSVTGTQAADNIAFTHRTVDGVTMLGVDLDADGKPENLVPESLVRTVTVSGRGGNDRLSTVEVPATIRVRVSGGAGNDLLLGGPAAERFSGGSGNDSVFGGRGNDVALLGSGDDRFGWAPGDGNDRVEGQGGRDTQLFLGSSANENITISAVRGGRVKFFRDVGNVTMDLKGVEVLDTDLSSGGEDNTTVRNLAGTGVETVRNTLGNNPGNQGRTLVSGTRRADFVDVLAQAGSDGTTATVLGLPATVELKGANAGNRLEVRTGGGNDRLNSSIGAGALAFTADGGAGDDQLNGGDADEVLNGGSGSDVIDGNKGNDTSNLGDGKLDLFIWDPGDGSDRVDGAAGTDVLVFRGSNGAEKFAVSRTGRNESRLTRDVGSITMDLRSVAAIDITAMGGADELAIGDLRGSGLAAVVANLSVVPGTPDIDRAVDTVTVEGSDRADRITISGRASGPVGSGTVEIAGLSAEVTLTRVEPTDRLTVNGRGGTDTFDSSALVAGTVELTTVQ